MFFKTYVFNTLNANLNPICHLLALLVAHPILHVSRIRVKTQYSTSVHCFTNFCNISISASFVMHLPEDGHKSSRNIQEVSLPYLIDHCTVMNYFTCSSNATFHEAPLYYNHKYTILYSSFVHSVQEYMIGKFIPVLNYNSLTLLAAVSVHC